MIVPVPDRPVTPLQGDPIQCLCDVPVQGSVARIAAWVFAPHHASDLLPSLWLLCLPGGTYRGLAYFDRQVPGYTPYAYSMARWLAQQGLGSIVIDHLGTGESTGNVSADPLSAEQYADAYAHLAQQVREQLSAGTLIAGLAPLLPEHLWLAATGHSFGGRVATLTQSIHACFDALVLLGSPSNDERVNLAQFGIGNDMETTWQHWASQFQHGCVSIPREQLRSFFYGSMDIPRELIDADEAEAMPIPLGLLAFMLPGAVQDAARRITCPLFLGFGESDIIACPRSDPQAYASASSITLYVQRGASHCANFAPNRFDLWTGLAAWCRATVVAAHGYRSPGLFGWPLSAWSASTPTPAAEPSKEEEES
jgi:pimeloyl-ACP methyl ester carboxylesterase